MSLTYLSYQLLTGFLPPSSFSHKDSDISCMLAVYSYFRVYVCSVPKNRPNYVDSQSHKKSL